MTDTQPDVVTFLKGQHQEIKRLFSVIESSAGDQRADAFRSLRVLLAVHETAEEEIVHPRARRTTSGGDAIVDARLREENTAKKMLTDLEKIGVDDADFAVQFAELKGNVLAHAEHEEHDEFPSLAAESDPEQLQRMTRLVETAERIAPTRPHGGVESPMANLAAGPFAALLDRARDAFQKM